MNLGVVQPLCPCENQVQTGQMQPSAAVESVSTVKAVLTVEQGQYWKTMWCQPGVKMVLGRFNSKRVENTPVVLGSTFMDQITSDQFGITLVT